MTKEEEQYINRANNAVNQINELTSSLQSALNDLSVLLNGNSLDEAIGKVVSPLVQVGAKPASAEKKESEIDSLLRSIAKFYAKGSEAYNNIKTDATIGESLDKELLQRLTTLVNNDNNKEILKIRSDYPYASEKKAFIFLRQKIANFKDTSDEDIVLTLVDYGWLVPFKGKYNFCTSTVDFIKSIWLYDLDKYLALPMRMALNDKYSDLGISKLKRKVARYYDNNVFITKMKEQL